MKKLLLVMFVLVFALCACGKDTKEPIADISSKSDQSSTVVESQPKEDMTEVIKQYQETYNADYAVQDAFVKEKLLLISDNQIIGILHIKDMPQVIIIPKDQVQRYESNSLADKLNISIYDKSNACIKICIPKTEEQEVLKRVNR